MFLLKNNTILYRVTNKFENYKPNYDPDTGKYGLYFANYQALALGMCLEYNQTSMEFCIYEVQEDILLSIDKYGFRMLEPDLYYDKNNKFICNVNTPERHNISHFDGYMYPLIDYLYENIDFTKFGEIFLNSNDLSKIQLIETKICYKDMIETQFNTVGITTDLYL